MRYCRRATPGSGRVSVVRRGVLAGPSIFAAIVAGAALTLCAPALAAGQGFTKRSLVLRVHAGPGGRQTCKVVADLYRPRSATSSHPAPAVLTTNGFGGSKQDQAGWGKELAARGYVVLSYSGLGFGDSSCRIELDSRTWDGEAASALVTFLGGGMRATNGMRVDFVARNARAHNGRHYRHDPEVAMIGGSYGGEVQFAAAANDPRIDTIVPIITWNNIDYSLAPNNATLAGRSVRYSIPGITKISWLNLFWLLGQDSPVVQPTPPSSCPNFAAVECGADAELAAIGYPTATTLRNTHATSVAYYMNRIRVPVLLAQGEDDTLFNLQEAVATYTALRRQHTPVKMVWQSWGHSDLATGPVPGELAPGDNLFEPSGHSTLEGRIVLGWLRHYLEGRGPRPALNFSFFRPWVGYRGDDAARAYASVPRYPVGHTRSLYLSNANAGSGGADGAGSIVDSSGSVAAGSRRFTTPAAGALESSTGASPIDSSLLSPIDRPGSFAEYESARLRAPLDVVGIPTLRVRISAPPGELAPEPAGTLGLFFRLEDIGPGGTARLPDGLLSPARFRDTGRSVSIELPGIVHRFAAGHRLAVVIAGSDSDYFLPDPSVRVTLSTSASSPGVLKLPIVGSHSHGPVELTAK